MHSRYLFILVGFLFYASPTLGQAFEPGLLVRSSGDTLRGEVENSFWVKPPTFIRFRRTPESPPELFKPRQLRSVSFAGGRYFRYLPLPLDQAAETRLDRLPKGRYPNIQVDTLLAEVLVDGPLSLLRVVLPGSTHYVLYQPGQTALDLSAQQYLRQTDAGSWAIVEGNNYLNQLDRYFSQCPEALKAAQKVPFTAKALAAVVQAYNETCTAARQPGRSWLSQASPRRRVALQGGVLAGVRYNRLQSESGYVRGEECSDCQVHPLGGLYADLFQPSRTMALYGELSLSTFRSQYSGLYATGPVSYAYGTYTYKAWLATARFGLRLFFPLPHEQQWLVGVGYETSRSFHSTFSTPTGLPLSSEVVAYARPTLLPNLGLGWRSQRLTLSLDGQLYRNRDTDTALSSSFFGSSFALRFGVAYRLSHNPDVTAKAPSKQP